MKNPEPLRSLYWEKDALYLLDQRLLPGKMDYIRCCTADAVVASIREMAVRGAPAIGVSAAYGMVLAAREAKENAVTAVKTAAAELRSTRPTAVNLDWAVSRMVRCLENAGARSGEALADILLKEARTIHDEDVNANRRLGAYGAALIPESAAILTHCNAGALAAAGYGTALGVIRAAAEGGKRVHVYVDETRPLLQGARLTALELLEEGIPATLIVDSSAGHLISTGRVSLVIVGADRIAANGDTANKVGTYTLAVLAERHGIPFYIAAPCSTIDLAVESGNEIVIEERNPDEITTFAGQAVAPAGIDAFNPAFDITPAVLIDALITERGVLRRPDRAGLERLMAKGEGQDV
jgi:methylthioribose-1-phosphate isomerase